MALEVPDRSRVEFHPDLRKGLRKGPKDRREEVGADGFRGREPQGADADLILDRGLGLYRQGQDPLRVGQESLSWRRKLQAVPHAIEERGAQGFFQNPHLGRHAGLGITQGRRRLGEAQGTSGRSEGGEGPRVHVGMLSDNSISMIVLIRLFR